MPPLTAKKENAPDEEGQLALVSLSTQWPKVIAKAAVLDHLAWATPPHLYLRDRKRLVALELNQ